MRNYTNTYGVDMVNGRIYRPCSNRWWGNDNYNGILKINNIYRLEYFYHMVNSNFKYILEDLQIENKYTSSYYPNLTIDNIKDVKKYKKKINNFMNDYNSSTCNYVLNINNTFVKSDKDVEKLYDDSKKIINDNLFMKQKHKLIIYIEYLRKTDKNNYSEKLYNLIKNMNMTNIRIVNFYVNNTRYSSGNPKDYIDIFCDLDKIKLFDS